MVIDLDVNARVAGLVWVGVGVGIVAYVGVTVVFRPYLHGVLHIMHIFTQSHLHYDVSYLNRQSGVRQTENLLLY